MPTGGGGEEKKTRKKFIYKTYDATSWVFFRLIDSERAPIGISRNETTDMPLYVCYGALRVFLPLSISLSLFSLSLSGCGITFAAVNQALKPARRSADGGLEVRADGDNSRTD